MKPFRDIFIFVFILFHIMIPLRYYLNSFSTNRSDKITDLNDLNKFDERYAYRMFSSLSLTQFCKIEFFKLDESKNQLRMINLDNHLFKGWKDLLQKCRPSVIEEVTNTLCKKESFNLFRSITVIDKSNNKQQTVEERKKIFCK